MLLLPLFLLKPNRNLRAWAIAIPALALIGIGFLFGQIFGPDVPIIKNAGFVHISLGISALWLVSYALAGMNRFRSLILALAIVVGIEATTIAYTTLIAGRALNDISLLTPVILGVSAVLMFALAGWRRPKNFKMIKFIFTVMLSAIILAVASMIINVPIEIATHGGPNPNFLQEIGEVLLAVSFSGIILGLGFFILTLPFLILLPTNSLYRARILAWLKLKEPEPPRSTANEHE